MQPSIVYQWQSSAISHTHAYLIQPISQLLSPPPQRVLDLGCGNGWLSQWLTQQGYDVVGVDPSPSGIEIAQTTYPHLTFASYSATPDLLEHLQRDPFDCVISTEVVEHCYAPRDWAQACYTALRPGGSLICSTPYHGYLKNLALALTGRLDTHFTALWDGGHIKFWSRSTLTHLLTKAGFIQPEFYGAGRLPYLWKSMILKAQKPND